MYPASRSHQKSKNVLIGLFVMTCVGVLVFYWSVTPESNSHTLAGIMLSYLVLWSVIFLLSNASKTEKATRFFLTTGSIALTVGFIELLVVAHVVDFRTILGTPVWEPWHHPANLLDPQLLHIHKAHDCWLWNGIEYRYDQYGLRNETDLESADLVIVGDSFFQGWGVSAADLLTTQLARELNRSVVNLWQSWYAGTSLAEVPVRGWSLYRALSLSKREEAPAGRTIRTVEVHFRAWEILMMDRHTTHLRHLIWQKIQQRHPHFYPLIKLFPTAVSISI